jgi:hypothetical protein
VKRPNTWWGIGQWQCVYPISLSGHARWPRTVKSEIYQNLDQNLNWFASLLASSELSTAEKQKHLLDTKLRWPRRAMTVNTRRFFVTITLVVFFLQNYTRRFFFFKFTLAVFFFRITRAVLFFVFWTYISFIFISNK